VSENLLKSVVIYSSRMTIVNAVRDELKRYKIDTGNIQVRNQAQEALELVKFPKSTLLVVDWAEGPSNIIQILSELKDVSIANGLYKFLLSTESSVEIAHMAAEYGINRVHIGAITQSSIRNSIASFFKEAKEMSPIKKIIVEIHRLKSSQRFDECSKILIKLHGKDPMNGLIVAELADLLYRKKKYRDAQQIMKPIVAHQQSNVRIINLYARIMLKLGDFKTACDTFEKARILNPYNPDRLIEFGSALLQIGHFDDADRRFDDANKIIPKMHAAQTGRGIVRLMRGELNEALDVLNKVTDQQELASLFNTAAILTIRLGQYEKGMALYDSALQLLGNVPAICSRLHWNKGIGFLRGKANRSAYEEFRIAVELDATNSKAKRIVEIFNRALGKGEPKTTEPQPDETKMIKPLPVDVAKIIQPLDIYKGFEDTLNVDELFKSTGMDLFSLDGEDFDELDSKILDNLDADSLIDK
jgi:tetratricopeptide (TPR) repeat protein